MEDQQIRAETTNAVEQAADAMEQGAKQVENAVETAAENAAATHAAEEALSETAKALEHTVETAAENEAATRAAAEAAEETAKAVDSAVETAAENREATAAVTEAVQESARKNMDATETAAVNKESMTKRGPHIPETKKESMSDYMDEIKKDSWDRLKDAMDQKEPISVKIEEVVKAGVLARPFGIRAFIPASKLSLQFIEEKDLPSYVGKTVEARVITCDKEENKLVMSVRDVLRKRADEERAKKVSALQVGVVTEGKVETLTDFGAFVALGDGLTGLVHVSRISRERIRVPADVLKVGDQVKVKIVAVKDGKISLSMKDVEGQEPEPVQEEHFEYKSQGEATTSLADLIKQAGF